MTTVKELVELYASQKDLSKSYTHQLRCFANVIQRVADDSDCKVCLRPEIINQLLERDSGYADETRSNFRRRYLCLATFAKKQGYIKKIGKSRIATVRKAAKTPSGYTFDEAASIVEIVSPTPPEWLSKRDREWLATQMQCTGIIRRAWWYAYLLASWDTGHPTDLRSLKRDEMKDDIIYRPRGKTAESGQMIFCRLNEATVEAITLMGWGGEYVFPNWGDGPNWTCLWKDYGRITALARTGGSLKWFRSGSGTDYEIANPGRGHELLSNGRGVFEKHYLIKSMDTENVPQSRPLVAAACKHERGSE